MTSPYLKRPLRTLAQAQASQGKSYDAHRFTSDEAFEAAHAGQSIMLDRYMVAELCAEHGQDADDYYRDIFGDARRAGQGLRVNAAHVLTWLGY